MICKVAATILSPTIYRKNESVSRLYITSLPVQSTEHQNIYVKLALVFGDQQRWKLQSAVKVQTIEIRVRIEARKKSVKQLNATKCIKKLLLQTQKPKSGKPHCDK